MIYVKNEKNSLSFKPRRLNIHFISVLTCVVWQKNDNPMALVDVVLNLYSCQPFDYQWKQNLLRAPSYLVLVHSIQYARYIYWRTPDTPAGLCPMCQQVLPNYGRFPSFQVLMTSTLRALTDKWNEVIEDGSK